MGSVTQTQYVEMLSRLSKCCATREKPADATQDESDLQGQIISHCRAKGWYVAYSRMDRKTRVPKGMPDLIIFRGQGTVLVVECKSKTGKLRPEQLGVKIQLESLGHTVHLIRSFSEFLGVI